MIKSKLKFVLNLVIAPCFMLVSMCAVAQSSNPIPVRDALKIVTKTFGTRFVYDRAQLNGKRTSYDMSGIKTKSVEEVLKGILYPNELVFLYVKPNYYTIVPKDRVEKDVQRAQTTPDNSNTSGNVQSNNTPGTTVAAQQNIRGRVIDSVGNGLQDVTVASKGTGKTQYAITDGLGNYSIATPDGATHLTFSAVGYEEQVVSIGGRDAISIAMRVDVKSLATVTVVATGYQNIARERATGSFGTVDKQQLEKPSSNIAQRLIGTTAGMQAKLDVNGNPTFEIRGQTSLYANAEPLIVVDGFALQGNSNSTNLFNTINPNDVESVTILKDAAAASIWGSRSANGVIVITTRNARKGTPLKVEFNAFARISKKFDLDYVRPLASSTETVDYERMSFNKWSAQLNSGAFQTNYGKSWSLATVALSEYELGYITAAQRDARLAELRTLDNRDQISENLLENPLTQQYNLSLYGSSGRMSNALSLMYESNQSNFKSTYNKRYMANYRTTAEVFKWLDFNLSAMLLYNKDYNNGVNLSEIQNISPYEMLLNPDGSQANITRFYWPIMERFVPMHLFPYADWSYNPIQEIQNRKITSEQLNTRLQAGLRFKIIKGLSVDSRIQYELFNTFNKAIYNENTFQVRSTINQAVTWNTPNNAITLNLPKGGMLTQNRSKVQAYNFRNQINFNREIAGRHQIDFAGGSEVNNVVTESFTNPTTYGYNDQTLSVGTFPYGPGGTQVGFPVPGGNTLTLQLKNWLGANQTFSYANSFGYRTERYFSLYGNVAYTFDRKYTLSGSYRTDASNLITDDPKYRYAPFWSIGGGWQISKEDFMNNIRWLDRLSVRATYGYNGNVDRSTSFRPLISAGGVPNVYTGDPTASITSFGNPTLRWEKTGTWNLGLDYSLFKGKVYGKLDLYNKSGRDLIAQLSIPAVNGTTSQKLNNAAMTNRGIELELGSTLRIKGNDIMWDGNLNFSYNENKITDLFVAQYPASTLYSGGTGAYVEGENANSIWRFRYAGIQNNQPMVWGDKGTKYDFGAFTPGDGREYMSNMGTLVAPYTLGMINSFKVYDFNFSFIVTGKFGHVFQRQGFNYPPTWTSRVLPNSKLSEVVNGDPSKIVPLPFNDNEPRYYFWDRFHQYLDYLIENASHVRLQEANLTYNLPRRLLTRFTMTRLQVYAQGNDLFTIYANKAGEDPEYPLGTMNPQPKVTFGIRCEF